MAATVSGSHTAYCTIDMVENFNTLTTLYSSLPCRWRLLREPPLLCVVCTVPDTPVDPVPQPSVSTTNTAAAFEACRNSVLTGSLITYDNIYYDAQSSFKRIGPVATKSNDLAWEKAISSKQRIFLFSFLAVAGHLHIPHIWIIPLSLSSLRPCCWWLWRLGLRPGCEVFLHLRVAWHWSLRLPAARVSDQAHMRGDHAGRQVHCRLRAEEPLLKSGTARTPANSAPLYQPPALPISQPSPARIHGYGAPPAMFPRCAWQNVKMSANNKINDPSPHAESIFYVYMIIQCLMDWVFVICVGKKTTKNTKNSEVWWKK